MIDATDIERLHAAGFTDQQVSAIVDTLQHATAQLVTRDYLDLRLAETRDYIDLQLQRQKISLLRWMVVFQAVFAAAIFLAVRFGGV
jgi:hypothetical protein